MRTTIKDRLARTRKSMHKAIKRHKLDKKLETAKTVAGNVAHEVAIDAVAIASGIAGGVVSAGVQSLFRVGDAIIEGVGHGVNTRRVLKEQAKRKDTTGELLSGFLAVPVAAGSQAYKEYKLSTSRTGATFDNMFSA